MKKIIILMVCLWGLGNTFTSAQTTEKEVDMARRAGRCKHRPLQITCGIALTLKSKSALAISQAGADLLR